MVITRFAESSNDLLHDCWFETINGKEKCDEDTIEKLWWVWVCSFNARRADTKEYTVFEFIKPMEIDLSKLTIPNPE